jgi:hypothetical protein
VKKEFREAAMDREATQGLRSAAIPDVIAEMERERHAGFVGLGVHKYPDLSPTTAACLPPGTRQGASVRAAARPAQTPPGQAPGSRQGVLMG